MKTLLLDRDRWDLVLDASGNIAVATNPYSLAQDVASAIRLFQGELWYDTAKGIPYFDQILGKQPPLQLMKAWFIRLAITVPGVDRAVCYLESIINRQVVGQIQFTDSSGDTAIVATSGAPGFSGLFILGSSDLGGGGRV